MYNRVVAVLVLALFVIGASGCSSRKVVSRVDEGEQIDLSGRWNDTDSRMVAQATILDCLNHPWIGEFMREEGDKPVVIVGSVRNKTQEHIPVNTFVNDIERAFINSGEVEVVASATEREDLRAERRDQRINASPETLKEMGKELGADYMMIGEINQIIDSEEGEKVSFYQADMQLIDIETNRKVWLGGEKIKKYIARTKYKP